MTKGDRPIGLRFIPKGYKPLNQLIVISLISLIKPTKLSNHIYSLAKIENDNVPNYRASIGLFLVREESIFFIHTPLLLGEVNNLYGEKK